MLDLRDKIRDMQEGEIVQLVVFQQSKYRSKNQKL